MHKLKWQSALGRLREVAPDTPQVRRDCELLWDHINFLERALKRIADGAESNPAHEVADLAHNVLNVEEYNPSGTYE